MKIEFNMYYSSYVQDVDHVFGFSMDEDKDGVGLKGELEFEGIEPFTSSYGGVVAFVALHWWILNKRLIYVQS